MAVRYSPDDTITNMRSISDTILNIDFKHAPLLQLFGFDSKNLNKFDILNWPTTKVEWNEDTNVIFSTLLTEAIDGSETDWDVTTGTGKYFRKGDVIGLLPTGQTYGDPVEKALVSSVSGDTITVVARGFGATSAQATNQVGDTVILITRVSDENAQYTTEGMTTPTQPYNYTQILDAFVEMSRTEAKMMRYGMHQNHMDYEITKLFDNKGAEGRLAKLLHRTFYWGERVQRTRSGDALGSMGGFRTFVTTSTASTDHVFTKSGTPLQTDDIHRVMRAIYDAGGEAPYVVTSSWGIEKIGQLYSDRRYMDMAETTVGAVEVQAVHTPHGDLKLVRDYMCDKSEYYFVNPEYIGWIPFDPFFRKSVYGDATNNPYDGVIEGVVGEYTLVVAMPKTHGLIYNAHTSA